MEEFLKLPQNLQTQENLDRLLDAEAKKRELEQKRLEVEELRLKQTVFLSQDQVLSCIPPDLEYSNERNSSRSTTQGESTAPSELVLWEGFFDEVASCSFGQQQKYSQPNFRKHENVANEESVRIAMYTNIFDVLNTVMKDEGIMFTNQRLDSMLGVPDFIGRKENQLILTIEVKKEWVLSLGDLTFPDYYAVDAKARTVISQAYTYMASNMLQYGVLTTYHQHWFLKRPEDKRTTLYISKTLSLQSETPTVLKAYAYLAKRAKEQPFCEHPDITIGVPNENSQLESPQRYSFRARKKPDNSNRAPQERTELPGSGNFQFDNFVGTYLGYGRCGTTFRCKYNGQDIALKLTDLSKKKFLLPELLKEIEIYHFLADIQGLFIPKLVGYGYMWGKMYFAIATTIVGKSLESGIKITRKQERNAYNALIEIHRHNVLHNDIRKENVILSNDGKSVFIIDFGLSTIDNNKVKQQKEMDQLSCLLKEMVA
ncbi:2560_t:CDS:2 [Funneliformis geosporum]|uniref:2560_t:CDS:1 n=1 Tax=Funneliformis geosporum TaxID=1117311 RepID=A0A9W4T1F5_9GLOM|nr:2560_t:CDS:2 [Funneliformis geosporum]